MDTKKEKTVGRGQDQLNQYNEVCNGCCGKTIPLMGRTRICPSCESEKKKEPERDEYGFEMRDPTPKEKNKLDNDIFDLDLDIFDLDLKD